MKEKITYKGFNKDLTCKGFQYEIGGEYEIEGEIKLCEKGFHACKNPFDVLSFYSDIDSRYCEVIQSGDIIKDDEKIVSSKIKIIKEIGFVGLMEAGIMWMNENISPNSSHDDIHEQIRCCNSAQIGSSGDYAKIGSSGDYAKIGSSGYSAKIGSSDYSAQIGSSGYSAQIGSSGYSAQIGSSGDYAKIGSSGDYAKIGSSGYSAKIGSSGDYARIESTGLYSVITCSGDKSSVKAKKGSWITLSEWKYNINGDYYPSCVKTEYVDGVRIKEDTWYTLINGEFVEKNS